MSMFIIDKYRKIIDVSLSKRNNLEMSTKRNTTVVDVIVLPCLDFLEAFSLLILTPFIFHRIIVAQVVFQLNRQRKQLSSRSELVQLFFGSLYDMDNALLIQPQTLTNKEKSNHSTYMHCSLSEFLLVLLSYSTKQSAVILFPVRQEGDGSF